MCRLGEATNNQNRTSNNERKTTKDQQQPTKTEHVANDERQRGYKEQQTTNLGMGQLEAHPITVKVFTN